MNKFESPDYYLVDNLLTDDEKMIRSAIREWVDEKVMPIIEDAYQKAEYPHQLRGQMGELGCFGANLPEKYGCAGVSNVAYGLMMQELERGDSGIRSSASVQGALVMYPIFTFGTEEQRQNWLPRLASGEAVGCFGLTEPDFGSNPGGMLTTAVKDGDSYVLNGAKMWITNGTISDVAVVWARLDGRVRGFLVEKGTPGFSAPEMHNKHSLRASITSELILQDVRIPEKNILPESGGLNSPLSCLTQARYGIAWGVIGAAMACYHEALNYAQTRIQFDKPIASFQLVQQKLVYMITEITKMQLLCLQLGRLKDSGEMNSNQVSMAKRNNVAQALEIARMARDILGANGITAEYQSMRHMCNLETVKTYEGTHDIHTLIIGNDITGIPAFK
ncbi:MAG TPA: acyl-CoA dehydrogenase family protein [Calditrichia bacterium]|nr:acyl-CoA dehydrogenase family protein [Calditrichota bacterium]HQU72374.1 acyl-CoA dehydrogenase family protein [Calditrichia bacterium]HQV30718.1 acyl-CoA dehydrogenase family protein [Calditrichia bacterium]